MADFNPIFEIDASKLLAKLHLAGQTQVPNSKVINTGIKDNDPKATPDKPENVKFEFSKSGEYQLTILKLISYRVPIDLSKQDDIVKADKELVKLGQSSIFDEKAAEEKEDDKKEDDKKEDDKKAKEEEKKEKEAEKKPLVSSNKTDMPSFLNYLLEADDKDKDDKDKEKNEKEIKKQQKIILDKLDAIADFEASKEKDDETKVQVKNMFKEGKYERNDDDFNASWQLFKKCMDEENKHRLEYKKAMLDELNGTCIEDMKTYFINFAGKDNQAKINENQIAQIVLDLDGKTFEKPTGFDKIKDGKIDVGNILAEMEKQEEQLQHKAPKDFNTAVKRSLGCAVGYKVDVD